MKTFLVLLFGLAAIAFVSATSLNEKVSFRPSTTVQMQKLNSKVLILPPRGNQNKKIERIIRLIHLMELACLEKYAKPVHSNNRFAYRRPFKTIRPLRMPPVRNDGSSLNHQMYSFYTGKPNQITLDNRRYFGNSRVIFVPPLRKITEKQENFTHNEPKVKESPPSDSRRVSSGQVTKEKKNPNREIFPQNQNNFKILEPSRLDSRKVKGQQPKEQAKGIENTNFNNENIKFIKLLPPDVVSGKAEEKLTAEHLKLFEENPDISETIVSRIEKPLRFPERIPFHEIKSTIAADIQNSSLHFLNQTRPKHIQQYEVQEIIEERVSIDLKNNEGDYFQTLPFKENTITAETGSQGNETGTKDFISNSINSVLKSLIDSEVEITPSTENFKKAFTNDFNTMSFRSRFSTSLSPRHFRTFSNQGSENFLKVSNENKSLPNREKQAKSVNVTPTDDGKSDDRRKKTTEIHTSELQNDVNDSRFNFTPTLAAEYQDNGHTAEVTLTTDKYTTHSVPKTEKNIQRTDVTENSQQKTSPVPETKTPLGSFEPTSSPIQSSDILANQSDNHRSLVSQETEEIFSQPMLNIENDAFEIRTTESQKSYEELVADNFTTTDIPEFTEIQREETSTTQTAQNTVNTVKSFSDVTLNDMGVTTLDFQEPTDIPKTFDLLTTAKSNLKKDEADSNINQEPRTTTDFHQTSKPESEEQRRSDILITENFNDYVDVDNNLFISNYLDRVKQGSSLSPNDPLLNMTTDSIIPLIPVVINDLREGKISGEDMSILPKVFGKHWTTVVALANSTDLDMLPLFKMKNEEDLKNVLQNLYSENLEVTTTKTTVTGKNDNYEPYDYLEEYKDLYEDILESETEDNEKKRKKLRHKRNEEAELQRMEAVQRHQNDIEEENQENNYIYEDILYGEISEDEDANLLELRLKMADFNINLNNLTSRTRNKTF